MKDDDTIIGSGTDYDTLTITVPDSLLDPNYGAIPPLANTMWDNSISLGGGSSGQFSSGQVLTSSVTSSGSSNNWVTTANTVGSITFAPNLTTTGYSEASLRISGKNPRIQTDSGEINLDDLAGMMQIVKDMIDKNSLPLPNVDLLTKHEVLQKSWEDVKAAYENYRITEAILSSNSPETDDDK
jgi:hypothetical protein